MCEVSEQRGPHVFEEISADKKNAAFVDSQPILVEDDRGWLTH